MLQAMDQVLEERYDTIQHGSDFACLLDTMSAGRDDSRLVEIALDIYNKVQSHPDPRTWLEAQGRAFLIRPLEPELPHLEKNPELAASYYRHGYTRMAALWPELQAFLNGK